MAKTATKTSAQPENPRAVAGSNEAPDHAQQVTDRMAADYAELANSTTGLLAQARGLPESVDDEHGLKVFSDLVVSMRDTIARSESHRKREKEPFLRGGQAVDAFFMGLAERLDKAMKILSKRVNDYQQRKLAEERRRRDEEARLAREAEERATAARAKQEQLAREAEEAAARARKPETIEKLEDKAADHREKAEAARIETMMAQTAADDARMATLQRPSEMVRERFDDGRLVTMRQVPYVEITDVDKLDTAKLWPFVKEEEKLRALKAWAKTTGHKKPMDGAIIEMRDDTVIR